MSKGKKERSWLAWSFLDGFVTLVVAKDRAEAWNLAEKNYGHNQFSIQERN